MQFKEAIKFYSFIQMMLMCKNIGHESCIILEIPVSCTEERK